MNMKTSRFGACFSAIKINMTKFVIGNSRAGSTRSIVGEQPIISCAYQSGVHLSEGI